MLNLAGSAPVFVESAQKWCLVAWMFRHHEYTKRCSAHAFGDPTQVKTFYEDLVATGHDLGVSMPAMESYAEAIMRFALTNSAQERVDEYFAIDPAF